jgi:hypothetical protein
MSPQCQSDVGPAADQARRRIEREEEVARDYMCQLDTEDIIIIMCNTPENDLQRLRASDRLNK